jgi:hypothetical protein
MHVIGLELDVRIEPQPARPKPDYSPLEVHATV